MRPLPLLLGVLALGALIWFFSSRGEGPRPTEPITAHTASSNPEPARAGPNDPTTDASSTNPGRSRAETQVGEREDSSPARLHVAVALGTTGRPLLHAAVHVYADGRPPLDSHQIRVTDDRGLAVFDALSPGAWLVQCDRGPESKITLRARETKELRFVVERGVDALVRALDPAGQPVARAEVLMWPASRVLDIPRREAGVAIGTTDVQGELRVLALPSLGVNGSWVAARHPTLGVSDPVMVLASTGDADREERTVVLEVGVAGSRIRLQVLDEDGRPIAGAQASAMPFDNPPPAPAPSPRRLRWVLRMAETDDRGLCTLEPLAPGSYLVRAAAEGYAPGRQFLAVGEAATLSVDLRLPAGAGLSGRVVDAAGAPLAGALILVQLEPEGARAITGPDGRYAFAHLQPAHALVIARLDGFRSARREIELARAETVEVEFQLEPLPHLRGRLIDEQGAALAGWSVQLHSDAAAERRDEQRAQTDPQGKFEFAVEGDVDYEIAVREPGTGMPLPLEVRTVRAQSDEVTILVRDTQRATAWIDGELVDHAGKGLLDSYFLSVTGAETVGVGNGLSMTERDLVSGHFRIGPLPEGRYRLDFASQHAVEFARGDIEVHGGEVVRLGSIEPPASGLLAVEVTLEGDIPREDIHFQIDGPSSSDIAPIDPETLRGARALTPGHRKVTIYGTGFRWPTRQVDIVAGETVTLSETLRPAVRFGLRLFVPAGEHGATFRVRDARGELALETEIENRVESELNWPFLDLGRFEVECVGESGKRYSGNFRVESMQPRTATLDVHVAEQGR